MGFLRKECEGCIPTLSVHLISSEAYYIVWQLAKRVNILEPFEEGLRASATMLIELLIRTESCRIIDVYWLQGFGISRTCILGYGANFRSRDQM